MKKLLTILSVAALMVGCNKARCVIVGDVLGVADGTIVMVEALGDNAVLDSVAVEGGKFRFDVNDEVVKVVYLKAGDSGLTPLFTESGKINVEGNLESDTIFATGTVSNDVYAEFKKQMTRYSQLFAQVNEEQKTQLRDEILAYQDSLIDNNMDNFFGVMYYTYGKAHMLPEKEVIATLQALPEHLRKFELVDKTIEDCERRLRVTPQEGEPLPHYIDIVQPDVKGKDISLKSVIENPKNRYVLLDFWASWCGPCMGEMPHLKKAYAKYHKAGFEIYGVSLDSDAAKWREAIEAVQMKWINVSSIDGFEVQAAYDYAVSSIPSNFLIDCKTGEIIAVSLRGEAVEAKLKELLKK